MGGALAFKKGVNFLNFCQVHLTLALTTAATPPFALSMSTRWQNVLSLHPIQELFFVFLDKAMTSDLDTRMERAGMRLMRWMCVCVRVWCVVCVCVFSHIMYIIIPELVNVIMSIKICQRKFSFSSPCLSPLRLPLGWREFKVHVVCFRK